MLLEFNSIIIQFNSIIQLFLDFEIPSFPTAFQYPSYSSFASISVIGGSCSNVHDVVEPQNLDQDNFF